MRTKLTITLHCVNANKDDLSDFLSKYIVPQIKEGVIEGQVLINEEKGWWYAKHKITANPKMPRNYGGARKISLNKKLLFISKFQADFDAMHDYFGKRFDYSDPSQKARINQLGQLAKDIIGYSEKTAKNDIMCFLYSLYLKHYYYYYDSN